MERLARRGEEFHILARGFFGGAGGAAKDAGCADTDDEDPGEGRIPIEEGSIHSVEGGEEFQRLHGITLDPEADRAQQRNSGRQFRGGLGFRLLLFLILILLLILFASRERRGGNEHDQD